MTKTISETLKDTVGNSHELLEQAQKLFDEAGGNKHKEDAAMTQLCKQLALDPNILTRERAAKAIAKIFGHKTTSILNAAKSIRQEMEQDNDAVEKLASGEKKANALQHLEEYISSRYELRFNTLTGNTEMRLRAKPDSPFEDVNKYMFNTMLRELKRAGSGARKEDLDMLLNSDFVKLVNPIHHFFNTLPQWDHTDHISAMAATVTPVNADHWQDFFKRWLVAVVANALDDTACRNHTCLVLTGGQGAFKTTWLNKLLPHSARRYLFSGRMDLDVKNKDTMSIMAEHILVNIDDQLHNLHFHKQREDDLKSLITQPTVKYRRPYDRGISEYPHACSFMGSVNKREFLTDSTGSRRFLSFEVQSIDIAAQEPIDRLQLFAQCVHLWKNNYQYWFQRDEIIIIENNNSIFKSATQEEELLMRHFSKPAEGQEASYLTGTEVKQHIEEVSRQKVSQIKLGEALNKLGFERTQRRKSATDYPVYVWTLYKRHADEYTADERMRPETAAQTTSLTKKESDDVPW